MANEGYIMVFHPGKEGVTVHKPGTIKILTTEKPVLTGTNSNGLWLVKANKNELKEKANHVYSIPSTEGKIRFLHAAAGFPTKETWLKAIKAGYYLTRPGVTAKTVNRHFPKLDETTKGHMKKQRQNVRSTKIQEKANIDQNKPPPRKMHNEYVNIFNAKEAIHTDQTGRFHSNFIDAEPMKSKTEDMMINAYLTLWKCLTTSNTVKPKMHMLDNKASDKFKNEIKKNCRTQLVPLDTHQRNLAERAIQTIKNHFKAIIQGLDETFPMKLWDRLLPQTILTLNLLMQSNAVPTVSAHQYVHGQFNYNAIPLAPLGCAVQMHEAPTKSRTWAENTTDGWYIQTSPEHYRCHKIYTKKTRSMRISDMVWLKHKYITQPTVTPADMISKALTDLTQALKGKTNLEGLNQIESLKRFKELLTNTSSPTHVETIPTTMHAVEPRIENPRDTTHDARASRVEQTPTVSFDTGTKPPNRTVPQSPQTYVTEPRVQKEQSKDISKVIINKPMLPKGNKLTSIPLARVPRCHQFDARTH